MKGAAMNRKMAAWAVATMLGGALAVTAPAFARGDHGGEFAGGGFAGQHAFSGGSSYSGMGYPRMYSGTRSYYGSRSYSTMGYSRGFSNSGRRYGWSGASTPPGWSHGRKTGWGGHHMPPGLYRHYYGHDR
jgi:hypothetical protein